MKKYKTIGVIGRFRPLHNGAQLMLEAVCNAAENAKINKFKNVIFVKVPFSNHNPYFLALHALYSCFVWM